MADKPSSGATDWGTTLNAHIAVGHDNDGAHKKSQVLTDMEWSPTSYAGEESITLPNGLIMKMGIKAGATSATVTFGTAFPNAIISVSVTLENATAMGNPSTISAKSTTAFTVKAVGAPTNYHWIAIGY